MDGGEPRLARRPLSLALSERSRAESRRAWQTLGKRYCASAWNVAFADVFNEPHSAAWGNGEWDDWALGAERIARAIAHACPRWLLFVEGVGHTTADRKTPAAFNQSEPGHNWAANLEGVRTRPLNMIPGHADKLVYSPHIYGPSVAPQTYFSAADGFPDNLPAIWEEQFGFIRSGSGPT